MSEESERGELRCGSHLTANAVVRRWYSLTDYLSEPHVQLAPH
ncbi:Uncharacterised protein [Mycobacteroides abscessus subsp. abscessus]|nr:Uncharacterised protein [Mycobacteroides abscessus subsp. abscessus]